MVAGLWEPPSWPILVTRFIQPPLLLLLRKYSQIHWNPLQIALLAICSFLSSPLLLWKQFVDSFSQDNDYLKYCKPSQPCNAARFASKYMHREAVYRFNPIGGKISFDLLDLVKLATCPPFFEWATAWPAGLSPAGQGLREEGKRAKKWFLWVATWNTRAKPYLYQQYTRYRWKLYPNSDDNGGNGRNRSTPTRPRPSHCSSSSIIGKNILHPRPTKTFKQTLNKMQICMQAYVQLFHNIQNCFQIPPPPLLNWIFRPHYALSDFLAIWRELIWIICSSPIFPTDYSDY